MYLEYEIIFTQNVTFNHLLKSYRPMKHDFSFLVPKPFKSEFNYAKKKIHVILCQPIPPPPPCHVLFEWTLLIYNFLIIQRWRRNRRQDE